MLHAVSELSQITITVADVGRALAFYRDVLGLPLLLSAGPNLAFLTAGKVRIMVTTPQGAGAVGANSILYFKVADIAAAHSAIVARGAKNEREPALTATLDSVELWTSFVRDPDGNLVGLQCERAG